MIFNKKIVFNTFKGNLFNIKFVKTEQDMTKHR